MNRLKATMLCTFSFARGRLIALAVIQMIMMALALLLGEEIKRFDVLAGADILVVIHLFVFGIVFYGRHNAFCISNSVSLKYRIYSFSAAAGGMCLIAALLTSVIYGISGTSTNFSFAEIFRYIIIGGAAPQNFLIASFFENLFYYISAVSFGSFIGSLRSAKGDGFTLIMLAISAALVFGFSFLGRYFVTPAVWLCVIPAVMLQSRFTAILLYIFIAATSLFSAYLLTYGVQSRTRRNKREAK